MSSTVNNLIRFDCTIDAQEAFTRIEQEALFTDQIDRKAFWGGYTRTNWSFPHPRLEATLNLFEKEGVKPGLAIDLACGKSVSALALVEKNWRVIAVDYSKEVLDNLRSAANSTNRDWVKSGRLTLVQSKVEDFVFPQNVTLVVSGSIAYFNPLKMREIWDKIHACLIPQGRFVGSFFARNLMETEMRAITGPWFADLPTVRALLEHKQYAIESCEHSKSWFATTRDINFVAQKRLQPRAHALLTINVTSFFNAIRALPLKGSDYILPFVVDRIANLREVAKCSSGISLTYTIGQALLRHDTTIASCVTAGSLAVWLISSVASKKLEQIVRGYIQRLRAIDHKKTAEFAQVMQKIERIQGHETIRPLFNPPPPQDPREVLSALLQSLGFPANQIGSLPANG